MVVYGFTTVQGWVTQVLIVHLVCNMCPIQEDVDHVSFSCSKYAEYKLLWQERELNREKKGCSDRLKSIFLNETAFKA